MKPINPNEIPAEVQPLYTAFTGELERVRPVIDPQYPRQFKDTVRRLDLLYAQFVSQKVPAEAVAQLQRVAETLTARDYSSSLAALQSIVDAQVAESAEWVTGVKRLIKMSEGVPV